MSFMDNLKDAVDAILHPGKETKKKRSIGDSLKFYYSVMIIPLILGIIVSLAINASHLLTGAATAAEVLIYFIILLPIGVLVDAGIYHLIIGKLFKLYKGDYSKAVSAFTFGIMPIVLIYWLIGPLTMGDAFGALTGITATHGAMYVIGLALSMIFGVWGTIVLIIALSNQMAISRLKALGTLLLDWLIVGIIFSVIAFALAGLFLTGVVGPSTPTLGSTCIGSTGIYCQNMALSNNHMTFSFGQSTGSAWTGTILYAVPSNTSFSTSDGSDAVGTLGSGQKVSVNIPILTAGSGTWTGTIYAVYNVGNATEEATVATVSVTAS